MAALLDEAKKLHLGTTAHLAQTGVAQMNAVDAARSGSARSRTTTASSSRCTRTPTCSRIRTTYNYNDEQWRFGQVARQWTLVKPHSEKWNAFLKELKDARRRRSIRR